ncbi:hypothetical protein SteCoe_23649 [Stentor coeruleus]|uniref:protein-tyrosine-phosphatase n=1 Tax=Stentor coeruleus TaxID=5963 RepID=A0A1R2BJE4_9CILI|nr:hypothetical protein SteCoe_23649 [Stentor coeruleus]
MESGKKVGKVSGPDYTNIDNFLYLGDLRTAKCLRTIQQLNIRHIVQLVATEDNPQVESSVRILKIPIKGGKSTDIRPVVEQALKYIHSAVSASENVLVHCKFGKNRSASIVIAYLMASKGITYIEAERFVKKKRPIVKIKLNTKNFLCGTGHEGLRKIMLS